MSATIKPLVLTKLNQASKIVDANGAPLPGLVQTINNAFANIIVAFTALADSEGNLADLLDQIVELNNLVTSVSNQFANDAKAQSLANSYVSPADVLTSSTASSVGTIVIADHTRIYGDGTTVAITGATLTTPSVGTTFYVFYSDPNFTGGNVAYQLTTNGSDAAQVNGIHCVGAIYVSSGDTGDTPNQGGGNSGPGVPTGSCVDADSYMPGGKRAGELERGDELFMLNRDEAGFHVAIVQANKVVREQCVRITTASGISLVASRSTPITARGDLTVPIEYSLGVEVPVLDQGEFHWEPIVAIEKVGPCWVARIDANDGTYAAGEHDGRFIFTHNKLSQPIIQ